MMMGSPTEAEWPVSDGRDSELISHKGHTKLPDYHDMSGYPKTNWWTHIASMGQEGVDLVKQLLRFDPAKRLSARAVSAETTGHSSWQALHHRYFRVLPAPTAPRLLPKPIAELVPRPIKPDELNGKPALREGSDGVMKRKAESPPVPGSGGGEERRVARKLFA